MPAFCAALVALACASATLTHGASLSLGDSLCVENCAPVDDLPDRLKDDTSTEPGRQDLILPPRRVEDRSFLGDFMPAPPVRQGGGLLGGDGSDTSPPAPR
ncbi:hypothetical protein ACVDG3_07925 [Meridianimarinicoccus sp. RP-17]